MKFGIIKFISLFLSSNFFVQKLARLPKMLCHLQSGHPESFTWPKNKNTDTGGVIKVNGISVHEKRHLPPEKCRFSMI